MDFRLCSAQTNNGEKYYSGINPVLPSMTTETDTALLLQRLQALLIAAFKDLESIGTQHGSQRWLCLLTQGIDGISHFLRVTCVTLFAVFGNPATHWPTVPFCRRRILQSSAHSP